jgi:CRP/FNR family transcriptional regulator, anaerobic regulatory protein
MAVQARLPVGDVSRVESQVGSTRQLAPNEFLFRTGEAKTCVYRVKSGAVCLYEQNCSEHPIVDFAFPGDYVGLGFLQTHACCARAVTSTELTCLPLEALATAIENDCIAQAKLDDAIEREFEYRRAALVAAGSRAPLERVAAFLVSLSRTNAHEGRDPTVIGESCPSVFAAGYLGLNIENLSSLLLELEQRGLVEPYSGGVRLRDIGALEKLASQTVAPVRKSKSKKHNNCTQGVSLGGGQNA